MPSLPVPVSEAIKSAFLGDFRNAWKHRHKSADHRNICRRTLAFVVDLRDGHGEVEAEPANRYVVEDRLTLPNEVVILHRKSYRHPMHAFRVAKRRLNKYVPKQRCWRKVAVWRGGKELRTWEYMIRG